MAESLWGAEFEIEDTPQQVKKIVSKIAKPKKIDWSLPAEKLIKSKNTTIEQKLQIIDTNTLRILGVYKDNTLVIRNKDQLVEYIDKAIENDILAIDTETNMSLDPLTCTLMGPCIYTPGMKQAYIPLNHVNYQTGERLPNQLTEQDIKEQFDRLNQAKTKVFTHNGTFDFEVLKCTTGYEMEIYWDTFIGSMLLDENEKSHGLKQQYISKIDPSIEKYSIDHLFGAVPYEYIDPDIFALYAATDAYMTYKLYLYQKEQFEQPGMERLYKLFQEVEIPLMRVVAQIELTGVEIDQEYAKRLGYKYHQQSDEIEAKINQEVEKYRDVIAEWRKTPEANYHPTTQRKNPKTGLKEDAPGKSKNELLEDPVSLKSPIQLAILLYDVLKVPPVNKEKPRGTGEDELKAIDLPLCKLMLEKRGLDKLIEVFIDKLPASVSEVDHRLHAHFNQCGTKTGRFSSTEPNL